VRKNLVSTVKLVVIRSAVEVVVVVSKIVINIVVLIKEPAKLEKITLAIE
jgi:hypothetical protein